MSGLAGQEPFTITFLGHRWRRFVHDPMVWNGPNGRRWWVNLHLIAREPGQAMDRMPLLTTLTLTDRAEVRILDGVVHDRHGFVNLARPIAQAWLTTDPVRYEQDLLRAALDPVPSAVALDASESPARVRRL